MPLFREPADAGPDVREASSFNKKQGKLAHGGAAAVKGYLIDGGFAAPAPGSGRFLAIIDITHSI